MPLIETTFWDNWHTMTRVAAVTVLSMALAGAALMAFMAARSDAGARGGVLVGAWLALFVGLMALAYVVRRRAGQIATGVGTIVLCAAGAYWGGLYLLPAAVAFAIVTIRGGTLGPR